MKIVINRCYGGFGLSRAAKIHMLENGGCEHIRLMTPREYYGDKLSDHEILERMERDLQMYLGLLMYEGKVVLDDHGYQVENRTCDHLIRTIETLGREICSGDYAKLAVIEIPDDIEYEIDEYDGKEAIAEKHRRWS